MTPETWIKIVTFFVVIAGLYLVLANSLIMPSLIRQKDELKRIKDDEALRVIAPVCTWKSIEGAFVTAGTTPVAVAATEKGHMLEIRNPNKWQLLDVELAIQYPEVISRITEGGSATLRPIRVSQRREASMTRFSTSAPLGAVEKMATASPSGLWLVSLGDISDAFTVTLNLTTSNAEGAYNTFVSKIGKRPEPWTLIVRYRGEKQGQRETATFQIVYDSTSRNVTNLVPSVSEKDVPVVRQYAGFILENIYEQNDLFSTVLGGQLFWHHTINGKARGVSMDYIMDTANGIPRYNIKVDRRFEPIGINSSNWLLGQKFLQLSQTANWKNSTTADQFGISKTRLNDKYPDGWLLFLGNDTELSIAPPGQSPINAGKKFNVLTSGCAVDLGSGNGSDNGLVLNLNIRTNIISTGPIHFKKTPGVYVFESMKPLIIDVHVLEADERGTLGILGFRFDENPKKQEFP